MKEIWTPPPSTIFHFLSQSSCYIHLLSFPPAALASLLKSVSYIMTKRRTHYFHFLSLSLWHTRKSLDRPLCSSYPFDHSLTKGKMKKKWKWRKIILSYFLLLINDLDYLITPTIYWPSIFLDDSDTHCYLHDFLNGFFLCKMYNNAFMFLCPCVREREEEREKGKRGWCD